MGRALDDPQLKIVRFAGIAEDCGQVQSSSSFFRRLLRVHPADAEVDRGRFSGRDLGVPRLAWRPRPD
jgi:hypothetical protein